MCGGGGDLLTEKMEGLSGGLQPLNAQHAATVKLAMNLC